MLGRGDRGATCSTVPYRDVTVRGWKVIERETAAECTRGFGAVVAGCGGLTPHAVVAQRDRREELQPTVSRMVVMCRHHY